MHNIKVSVIIPVYNAEKTVGKILSKLISQDYRNIEIIVINDGSLDSSLELLRQFEKKDERILVLDQNNKGVSIARNVGIANASGEFITFIDSDDDISEHLISTLVKSIDHSIDLVVCGMSINKKAIVAADNFIDQSKLITKYVLSSLLTMNLLYGPCCKLFRRSIVVMKGLVFQKT